MRVDTLAEDKSAGLLCVPTHLSWEMRVDSKGKNQEAKRLGIPWQSSGQDSALSLLRAQVRSLVGELRSHELCGAPTPTKTKRDQEAK